MMIARSREEAQKSTLPLGAGGEEAGGDIRRRCWGVFVPLKEDGKLSTLPTAQHHNDRTQEAISGGDSALRSPRRDPHLCPSGEGTGALG